MDHAGRRYGMLTVIERAEGESKWLCRCDCGNTKIVHGDLMRKKSCGCLPPASKKPYGEATKKHSIRQS